MVDIRSSGADLSRQRPGSIWTAETVDILEKVIDLCERAQRALWSQFDMPLSKWSFGHMANSWRRERLRRQIWGRRGDLEEERQKRRRSQEEEEEEEEEEERKKERKKQEEHSKLGFRLT